MTARIIWIFRNNEHSAVAPRSALSAGAAHAARPVVLPARGRAALPSLHPRVSPPLPARGNLACSMSEQAPSFDATAERWIVPPSGMTPDAGAAAVLRHPDTHKQRLKRPAAGPSAAGHLWAEAVEVFTVALGLTTFGLIAAFFLVLA